MDDEMYVNLRHSLVTFQLYKVSFGISYESYGSVARRGENSERK